METRMTASPSPAARARTIAYGVTPATLTLPDGARVEIAAHTTDAVGRPLLLARPGGPVARAVTAWPDDDMPVALEIADLAPVPLPDRVRGRMWITGWVGEVPMGERAAAFRRVAEVGALPDPDQSEWRTLRIDIAEIDLCDGWGSADVDVDEYAAAVADPLVRDEAGLMRHLDGAHRHELGRLCGQVPALAGATGPRALGVDVYGLWVRTSVDGTPVNVRFTFPEPVDDTYGLQRAYRALLASPATTAISRP
jgi:hypothetical protein